MLGEALGWTLDVLLSRRRHELPGRYFFHGRRVLHQGSSPSGKFGVSLNQLDTMPPADGGLCDSSEEKDCENATLQLALPDDAETWTKVRVPWSALTPGVG